MFTTGQPSPTSWYTALEILRINIYLTSRAPIQGGVVTIYFMSVCCISMDTSKSCWEMKKKSSIYNRTKGQKYLVCYLRRKPKNPHIPCNSKHTIKYNTKRLIRLQGYRYWVRFPGICALSRKKVMDVL